MGQVERFGRIERKASPALAARRNGGWTTLWLMALAFFAAATVGSLLLDRLPVAFTGPAAPVAAMSVPSVVVQFPICGGGARHTCVVDGDTFWLDGLKYRIADIDTPEVRDFGCPAEKALGDRATARLAVLLNAGPFVLHPADRDEDRYGRKLRVVTRGGASLGAQLVSEGLAHRWGGAQRSWC